ncbi:hypothetical protein F4808DRAFT_257700 [Astrocystis sublimbata]|nr:hypothetical protein F4808DRAFT_257700 [Astrocystis sublimbata]
MLLKAATFSGFLVALCFTASVDAQVSSPVRLSPRADNYVWTVTWTGPKKCTSWPCAYSYKVSAPSYTTDKGLVPIFDATCVGTVDQQLKTCSLSTTQADADTFPVTVSGNFSTYQTSGVGSGLIDIKATWFDQESGANRTLQGTTPMQANTANLNTWMVDPEGCPITHCDGANATRTVRRGSLGL